MAGPMEAVRQTISTHNVASPVGVEVMREVRGDYRGEQVAQRSESSKLTDAAEELGMSVAHRSDKKSLGQRQIRQGQATNIEALARIAEYYDKLPNMPSQDELKALIEKFKTFQELLGGGKGGGDGVTKEDVLAQMMAALEAFDSDPTHQFVGIEGARAYFEAAGADEAFLNLLDDAKANFERGDLGRDVRAGFAAAQIADKKAATLETDPAAVRDTYRGLLRESGNMGQLFDALAKFDMTKKFGEIVDTFMEIAGHDLGSTGPSSDPTQLHGLLTELSRLKKLKTVFDEAKGLIDLTERPMPKSERGNDTPAALTSRLLNFAAKVATNLGDARSLIGGFADTSAQTQVVFGNGLKGLHAMLPDDMLPSTQARQQQVTTLNTLLGHLVAAEEAEYEGTDISSTSTATSQPGQL